MEGKGSLKAVIIHGACSGEYFVSPMKPEAGPAVGKENISKDQHAKSNHEGLTEHFEGQNVQSEESSLLKRGRGSLPSMFFLPKGVGSMKVRGNTPSTTKSGDNDEIEIDLFDCEEGVNVLGVTSNDYDDNIQDLRQTSSTLLNSRTQTRSTVRRKEGGGQVDATTIRDGYEDQSLPRPSRCRPLHISPHD
jgi:hypothetical protein